MMLKSSPERARVALDSAPAERRVQEMCRRLNISRKTLLYPCRRRRIAWARQEIMLELHRDEGWSYPRIAGFFGLDHTTILHGVKAATERAERRVIHRVVTVDGMSHVKQGAA